MLDRSCAYAVRFEVSKTDKTRVTSFFRMRNRRTVRNAAMDDIRKIKRRKKTGDIRLIEH